MAARRGQLLPCADHWQVLTVCHQYRPGAPAEGQRLPCQSGKGQPGGAIQQQGHGGRRGTIGGSRRSSFRAFAR